MAFERGFMKDRVTILSREASKDTAFGRTGGNFIPIKQIWANVSFTKGKKAMAEGALDAYETYMVRCDWHKLLKRECRLSFNNRIYQIESLNEDRQANEVQITCTELQK